MRGNEKPDRSILSMDAQPKYSCPLLLVRLPGSSCSPPGLCLAATPIAPAFACLY